MQRLNHLFLILLFLGSTITIKIQYDATPEVQFDFKAYASDFNLDDKPDLVNLCVDFRFKKEGYYSFNLQFQIASLSQNMNIPHLQYNQKIWIQSEYPKYKTTKCIFWKSDLEGDLKIHLFIFQENQLVDEKVVYLSNFGTSDFSFIYDLFSYDSDFDLLNDSMYLKIGLSEDVNVIQDYNFLIDINITINNERRILDTQQINLNSHNHLTYIMALPTTPKQSQMNTSLQIKNTYNEPLTVKKTFNWINNQSQPRSIFSIVNQSHNTIYPSLEFYFTLNKNIPVESFSLQINLTIILKDHILNFTYNKSYFYNPEDIYSYYNYWNSPENTSLTMIIDISDNWGILLYNQTKNIDVVKSVYNQQYPNIYFEVVSSDQDIFTDTLIVNYQLMNSTNSFLNSSICVYSSGEENVIQTSTIEIQNENGITQFTSNSNGIYLFTYHIIKDQSVIYQLKLVEYLHRLNLFINTSVITSEFDINADRKIDTIHFIFSINAVIIGNFSIELIFYFNYHDFNKNQWINSHLHVYFHLMISNQCLENRSIEFSTIVSGVYQFYGILREHNDIFELHPIERYLHSYQDFFIFENYFTIYPQVILCIWFIMVLHLQKLNKIEYNLNKMISVSDKNYS